MTKNHCLHSSVSRGSNCQSAGCVFESPASDTALFATTKDYLYFKLRSHKLFAKNGFSTGYDTPKQSVE